MRELYRRPRAEADLVEIWLYTEQTWGEAQADAYLDQIEAALLPLRSNPMLGIDCSHIRAGYRKIAVNRHRVYYRYDNRIVDIIRILHARMDVDSQLD